MANPVPPMFLTKPILHVSGITPAVSDSDLITALHECLRARLKINREGSRWEPTTGVVEFEKLENAEKAYATLHNHYLDEHQCTLKLSHTADPTADPKPSAKIRLVKFLPPDITPGRLFVLFRPFGSIYRVALNYIRGQPDSPVFSGTALIEFYDEGQAALAQAEMHCADVQGCTIAVEEYDDKRDRNGRAVASINPPAPPSRWAQATPFVPVTTPTGMMSHNCSTQSSQPSENNANVSRWANAQNQIQPYHHHHHPTSAPLSPTQEISHSPISNWTMSPKTPLNGARLSPAALAQVGKKQIDPCNLFLKGLGADVDSGDLFHAFKRFGTIVSARVMKNEVTGISKQFGFVSFSTEAATASALEAMDGAEIGRSSNKVIVRLHELKKYKEGRTKVISVTSPTGPHDHHFQNGFSSNQDVTSPIRSRAGSIDARTDIQMAEVLASMELNRLQPGSSMMDSPVVATSIRSESRFPISPTPAHLQHLHGLPPPSRHSPTPSIASLTPLSEREKILTAVLKLNDQSIGQRLDELVDLLMGLPTKERKLCLFNPQVLATKVCEAKEIMDTPDEVSTIINAVPSTTVFSPSTAISTPSLHVSSAIQSTSSPTPVATPSRPTSAGNTHSPASGPSHPVRPAEISEADEPRADTNKRLVEANPTSSPRYVTMVELAKLPSKEIVELVFTSSSLIQSDILPKFDPKVRQETDDWIDKLTPLSIHQQKQKLGEKVFKTLRGYGIKGCPKITVDLLDSEDLRSLAHLMNSFSDILKQKVMAKTRA